MDDRTYSQLLEDRATARRAAQANAQALSERDAELAHARPVAAAAHAYCAAWLAHEDFSTVFNLHQALLDAHQATTPSEVPSSHVIVERAELERLRRIADGVGELLMVDVFDECSPAVTHLRQIVNEVA
jgi:hypothetical protein